MRGLLGRRGPADDVAGIVDPVRVAEAAAERAQVADAASVPQERVEGLVVGEKAGSDRLACVVHPVGDADGAAEASDVLHTAALPHEWMHRGEAKGRRRGRVEVGLAQDLPARVGHGHERVRSSERPESRITPCCHTNVRTWVVQPGPKNGKLKSSGTALEANPATSPRSSMPMAWLS